VRVFALNILVLLCQLPFEQCPTLISQAGTTGPFGATELKGSFSPNSCNFERERQRKTSVSQSECYSFFSIYPVILTRRKKIHIPSKEWTSLLVSTYSITVCC
jgi:hypothetical protein